MRFVDKTILIISPEDWGDCWLSKHHYAHHLAGRDNQVFFLGPCRYETPPSTPEGVTLLKSPKLPRGIRFLPAPVRRKVHRQFARALEAQAGVAFDLAWSFDPSRLHDLEQFAPNGKRLFYLADLPDATPWNILAASADLCLGCSGQIVSALKQHAKRVHFMNHGFVRHQTEPYDFGTSGQTAVYAGNLAAKYLDVPRITRLIDEHPRVGFHFYGDTGEGNLSQGKGGQYLVGPLRERKNAHLRGSVSPGELASIYKQADVLLLFYDPFDDVLLENSHKWMEYLGSGTPILATRMNAYDEIADLLEMHDDPDDYCGALSRILEGESEGRAQARIEFAEANSYEANLERIEQLLGEV